MILLLQVYRNGNVYGAMPHSFWRSFSICLMLIHQVSLTPSAGRVLTCFVLTGGTLVMLWTT